MSARSAVDKLQGQIAELVAERQVLRSFGANPASLEQNRRELVRSQWDLSHALIAQHTYTRLERTDRSV
jgi:hypothetical protein